MSKNVSDCEYEALEPTLPLRSDPEFGGWAERLMTLSSAEVSIREATADPQDGRRMKDLQVLCSPISVRSVRDNALTIAEQLVLLAEIDDVHIGFCISSPGLKASDPLFIQVVAVAPAAQRRGAGLALLTATADRGPRRDIALATQDDNTAARSLNEMFAKSIGASIRRVRLGTYRDSNLGIQRGLGYRAWVIQRPPVEP
ncbi:GNAT family N-acetyltransferase [Cryobacterium sp. M25]|uniref:GNAT family N-acetyltransferase n=1 Tax=Cryobacterium sp. M25 TaxID=2048293 RepID=UPI0011B07692|nr:GNAT family N-acetyltransferase [Cryobacterium sp. M25]